MPPQIASSVRLRASFIHWRRSGALFRWCWWGYSVSAASAVTASALLASPVPRFQNPNLQAPAAHYTSTPLTSCYTLPAACNGTTSPVLSAPPGGRTSLPCAAISSLRALSRRETWTPYLLAVATNSSIGNSAPAIYAFVALPAGLRCGAWGQSCCVRIEAACDLSHWWKRGAKGRMFSAVVAPFLFASD
ncbi:hypothetical protein OsJ_21081 [Oryza sativa Japonica Group]|uniref:Uncharacterized protein n=2 Tax=Oryza TaxID=4527 RepID=Q5Z4C2_ORYSJ|nr:hypothetical protein OsJ_21081 [Oryza sativa Japonica Group]BAD62410.1 hypothetical protein [Oryza sativa Japonica Group]